MKPKIIEITQDIKTFYGHTYDVPNGIPALINELEKRIDDFHNHHLYGVTDFEGGKLIYRACIEETHPGEGDRLNLPYYNVPQGKYLYVVLKDWQQHISKMPVMFDSLLKHPDAKKDSICLEDYLSLNEMLLLVEHQ